MAAIERQRTVATAESCTGGLLGHVLTEVPGSSAYYLGGIVSYADDVKIGSLGVPADLLATHGAVSEPVAAAMAEGARARLGADLAASVTGIAGPGGDTPGKPVGLDVRRGRGRRWHDRPAPRLGRGPLREQALERRGRLGPAARTTVASADRPRRRAVSGANVGQGLAPARAPRPIEPGERIHIIGAAGAGASAAALLAHSAGALVTACDPGAPSPYTAALDAAGIVVATEHDPSHVVAGAAAAGAGIVSRLGVTKALTSVSPDHPELAAARAAGIAVEAWQQVVADAAATHGGTTRRGRGHPRQVHVDRVARPRAGGCRA